MEQTSKEKQAFMQKYQQAITEKSKLQEASAGADPVLNELMPSMYTDADVEEKIKEIEQQHKCKDAILHQQIKQMQNIITDLKRENEAVKDTLAAHKAMVSSLEHQVSSLNYQLSLAVDESDQHKTAAEQIRLAIRHGEQSTEQLQLILIQKDGEINIAENKIKTLESDVEELKDILKHRETEIKDLKSVIVSLEEGKDELTKAVNEKDLQLSALQQQMYSKELRASELKITSSALEADVEKVQAEMRLKDEEISSLKEQLQSKAKHIEETLHSLDVLRQENSRLLEELSLLTKENRFVTKALENKLQELEEMRRKDTGYVAELSRIQEVLSIKEQQRTELLEQYKNLSYENARLETETERLQSETEAVHIEMQANVAKLQNLHSTVQLLQQEIREYMAAQEAHRLEMTFLNSSVSGLEAELHQKQQEIERLQGELTEVRSFSVQIDASREHMQKLLADEGATNAKLTAELEDLRDEMRAVRAQLSSERTSVLTMESLIAAHREKEFRSHLINQELNAEISVLRNRHKESIEKIEALTKELSTLKTEVAELKMERERLKRDITDERYERERDHNELLRLQHRQLYASEPTVKSSALFHSKFTSPGLKSLPSQEAVPVPSTSETKALNKTKPEVSSKADSSFVAETEMLQPSLFQATASEFGPSEEGEQMYSKETTKQFPSGKTQSLHKMDSLEQPEKESSDDKISSQSSSKDLPSNGSHK